MTPICNDVLTRIRQPKSFRFTPEVEIVRTVRVGDKGEHNKRPYTVKAFGVNSAGLKAMRRGESELTWVWMLVKIRGDRAHAWLPLLIGDSTCFAEKLVPGGRHPNPAFTHYWPKDWENPL